MAAVDVTRGDLRAVQRFSRHLDVKVLLVYDDNRQDLGGRVASLVAGATANGLRSPDEVGADGDDVSADATEDQ